MDTLLSKITDLGYEFFGIILPGVITSIFLCSLLYALGPLVPFWTKNNLPHLTIESLKNLEQNLIGDANIVVWVLILAFWYFIGIILKWLSRSREYKMESELAWHKLVYTFLKFRTPRPAESYHPSLEPLFISVSKKFSETENTPLEWRQYYPVAKSYLRENLNHSLVSTYQNKYTLHRSIATAGSLLFWFTSVSIVVALITFIIQNYEIGPSWPLLVINLVASVVIIAGFARSYLYNWRLFGDMVITETYSQMFAPQKD